MKTPNNILWHVITLSEIERYHTYLPKSETLAKALIASVHSYITSDPAQPKLTAYANMVLTKYIKAYLTAFKEALKLDKKTLDASKRPAIIATLFSKMQKTVEAMSEAEATSMLQTATLPSLNLKDPVFQELLDRKEYNIFTSIIDELKEVRDKQK